jgi:hypothetical protein
MFAALLVIPSTAHAYIDPGAGSMLLQILIGGFAGVFVVGRLFWKSIVASFQNAVTKFLPKSKSLSNSESSSMAGTEPAHIKD